MNPSSTEQDMLKSMIDVKLIARLIVSFVLSFIFIWAVSFYFHDTLITFDYDNELNEYIVTPGIVGVSLTMENTILLLFLM